MTDALREETVARLKTHERVVSVEFVGPSEAKVSIRVEFAQDDKPNNISFTGVRSCEDVMFVFEEGYPCSGISLKLRRDFPRNFPHINPSEEDVVPCVFEGRVSELLQQPKGILGFVDQVVDWLDKAAVGELMNPEQGWEYMRTDRSLGSVYFPLTEFRRRYERAGELRYLEIAGRVEGHWYFGAFPNFAEGETASESQSRSFCVFYVMESGKECNEYSPFCIRTFKDLKKYLNCQVKISGRELAKIIDRCERCCRDKNDLVVIVGVRRPYHLIGTDSAVEFLGFHVDVSEKDDNGKIHGMAKVESLSLPEYSTPELMRRLSGHGKAFRGRIFQLGCGSLGSKILMHLARNGNDKFVLVDNAQYYPHNNARHACVSYYAERKVDIAKATLIKLGVRKVFGHENFMEAVSIAKNTDVIIDSMATISGRNWLSKCDCSGHVVHTALYNHGQAGLLLMEGAERSPRIDDLFWGMMRSEIRGMRGVHCSVDFAAKDFEVVNIGQGCSSFTTVMDDSLISLHASGMAIRIQRCLDEGFPENGMCAFSTYGGDGSVVWKTLDIGKTYTSDGYRPDGYEVRVLSSAIEDIEDAQKKAGETETGGVLCAAVNEPIRTITVVACLPPPPDSKFDRQYFELGKEGVRKQILQIQRVTGNCVTSIGTWHTHPFGGNASTTDRKTYEELFSRRKFPTLCMIWKPDGSLEFLPDDK